MVMHEYSGIPPADRAGCTCVAAQLAAQSLRPALLLPRPNKWIRNADCLHRSYARLRTGFYEPLLMLHRG